MNRILSLQFFVTGFCLITATLPINASEFDLDDSTIKHIEYPGWFKTSFLDLGDDVDEARNTGKLGLMLLFTTEGCSYCDVFIRKSLGDPELAALTQKSFDSIGFEIFDDSEITAPDGMTMPIKQFANQVGAEYSPTLVFLNTDGEMLLKVVGYQSPQRFRILLDFFRDGHYQTSSLSDYATQLKKSRIQQTIYKPMRDDSLFSKPPYMLDRSKISAEMPLLVLFEAENCEACDQFHDQVLADVSIRKLLDKFEVVQLDANDNSTPLISPNGDKSTPKKWFNETGMQQLPAMLFFNESGNEVLRTDAMVLNQRMDNSLNYVLEKAYEMGWTYQRFARTKSIQRLNSQQR